MDAFCGEGGLQAFGKVLEKKWELHRPQGRPKKKRKSEILAARLDRIGGTR